MIIENQSFVKDKQIFANATIGMLSERQIDFSPTSKVEFFLHGKTENRFLACESTKKLCPIMEALLNLNEIQPTQTSIPPKT